MRDNRNVVSTRLITIGDSIERGSATIGEDSAITDKSEVAQRAKGRNLSNNNISTSNFNTNPASDHLQHKRHQQHIPTSGIVTNFGYSDWGISPSAS